MMTEEALDGMAILLEANLKLTAEECIALVNEVQRLNAAYEAAQSELGRRFDLDNPGFSIGLRLTEIFEPEKAGLV